MSKIAPKNHNTHKQLILYLIDRLQISGYHTKTYMLTTHQIISEYETHNYNTMLKIFNVIEFSYTLAKEKLKSKANTSIEILTLFYALTTLMSIWFILLVCCRLADNTNL